MTYLIADSGSTKCTWLVDDGVHIAHYRTRGINAALHSMEQVREALLEFPPSVTPDAIFFYGAGCGWQFPQATETLKSALEARFGTVHIEAESDLLGAARALCGRKPGIACILGTGSNSCHYDGGRIVQNIPPLGYVLGDEGSGSALGQTLVNGIFKGHIPLREEFLAAHDITYEEVIRRVYREPYANRFLASLAPFVKANMGCREVQQMVDKTFGEFIERNLLQYPAGLPVSFVGGVAAHFEQMLRPVLEKYNLQVGTIVESPAEGLLKYHYGE